MSAQKFKKKNRLKAYHKWLSLILSLFIILFAISGIVLNHRNTVKGFDLSRKCLPTAYRYHNWNLASIKGSVSVSNDSLLVFGNIGIWKTANNLKHFRNLNKGLPKGADQRKITSICKLKNNELLASSVSALYKFNNISNAWEKVSFPEKEARFVKILNKGDSVIVLTRNSIWVKKSSDIDFKEVKLQIAENDDRRVSLFRTIWVFHSGEISGLAGKLFVDGIALVLLFLTISGLLWFASPGLIKRLSGNIKVRLQHLNGWSLKWHNKLGIWTFTILILSALSGIFLRPPLLILIAESRIFAIPGTLLDHSNPWQDKLRYMIYDADNNRFILSTSEGIFSCDSAFQTPPRLFKNQPPISVMGINVMEKTGTDNILIGSFSGIFEWMPEKRICRDVLTGENTEMVTKAAPPFGSVSIAGAIFQPGSRLILFDYAKGALSEMPVMSETILRESSISLWATALEIHTGRIWEDLLGPFYILVVPLTGIGIIVIIITGVLLWLKKYRNASARKQRQNQISDVL